MEESRVRAAGTVTENLQWLTLVWRLPSGGSTERVSIWRALKRLGAVSLTPGAAALPFREELQEELDWLAQEVDRLGGDAWVLPVARLSALEIKRIRDTANSERAAEYDALRDEAQAFLRRAAAHTVSDAAYGARMRTDKELLALQRRFRKIRQRDYFAAPGRKGAALTIDRCLRFRQGISRKLELVTDAPTDLQETSLALRH
jgi:hypothetical protein